MTTDTLGDALPREMTRVRDEVMPAYVKIGPAGSFALAMMRRGLDAAQRALAFPPSEDGIRARVEALEDGLRRAIEALERAEPNRHSPWCNGVHEGGACEGDYLMGSFMADLRALAADRTPAPEDAPNPSTKED